MAIFELVEEITTAMDNSMSTVGVFIDLKKAFDTVDHNILLNKLEHYGIRGLPLGWIQSHLTNRTQHVSIYLSTNSTCIRVTCGVPQGSIIRANFIYIVLDGYPASLRFPIMHRVMMPYAPNHNCHHIKSCYPSVKQYILTHRNTELIIYTCSLFVICNTKVPRASAGL